MPATSTKTESYAKTGYCDSLFIRFASVFEDVFAAIPDGERCHFSIETPRRFALPAGSV